MSQQEYNLDLPQFDAKQGYLQNVFQKRVSLHQTLSQPELPKNSMNLYFQVQLIICDEIRNYELSGKILDMLDNNINKKLEDYRIKYNIEPDREKYTEIVLSESVRIMREVTKYNDKFLNIATEKKVKVSKLECTNCPYRLNSLKEDTKVKEIYEGDENVSREVSDE